MSFFTSGFFWFVEGILFCLVLVGLRLWTKDRNIPMPWWKWILSVGWLFLLGFTVAFIGTSLGEGEGRAALAGGTVLGLLIILSGSGIWIFMSKK